MGERAGVAECEERGEKNRGQAWLVERGWGQVWVVGLLIGAQAMGLEVAQAVEAVCSMRRSDFYKSMTTYAASQVWQDVYCPETPAGTAYVKVTLRQDGSIVIQFRSVTNLLKLLDKHPELLDEI